MNTVCQHCGQIRQANAELEGSCEHCGEPLHAPPRTDIVPPISANDAQVADTPDPLAEFVVFDRDGDPVPGPAHSASSARSDLPRDSEIDYERVAVPRSVLYMQGVLLGIVAIGFFVLGILVGMRVRNPSDTTAVVPRPCVVTGSIAYKDESDRKTPDAGAVVILLPAEKLPQKKSPPHGLRPDDELPDDDHAALSAIREIGGDYGRTDADGRYELLVTSSHSYFVLFISSRLRQRGEELAKRDLAELGSYFLPADKLIGRNKYVWYQVASIRSTHKRLKEMVFE